MRATIGNCVKIRYETGSGIGQGLGKSETARSFMRAIILAAGIGYRLLPLTRQVPKCMVPVAGKAIIGRAVDALVENGIRDIVVVIGYQKEMIKQFLSSTYGDDIAFTFVENDIYDKTNNIYSLWLASQWFDDDIILLESDVVFANGMIADLLASEFDNVIVVDHCHAENDGTVVRVDAHANVYHLMTKDHLQYPHEKTDLFKTVNIYRFSRDFLEHSFFPVLENYIKSRSYSKYYELILGTIIYLESPKLKALAAGRHKWFEIDTYPDLVKADYLFSSDKQKMQSIEKSYGGLWNYAGVTDFGYMRNVYFPPQELLGAMQRRLESLVTQYPSRQDIVNQKAAMLEYLNEDHFFLFNGSSQAIKLLSKIMGTVCVPVPTFQEYIHTLHADQVNLHRLPLDTFAFDPDLFVKQALAASADCLVMVNPNNPGAYFMKREQLAALLETSGPKFRLVVVDESFIDFADPSQSLRDLVDEFDNLVIVKSLGKAYGVAGLRLGYLYSRNSLVKNAVEEHIPIWNINSFAEYFIEEALKYRQVYLASLNQMKKDRDDFYQRLAKIAYLKVFKPHGNFIMVEIKKRFALNADAVKQRLFSRHALLVKDLSPKISDLYKDYNGNGFLRFAVLKKEQNDLLCESLEQIDTDA